MTISNNFTWEIACSLTVYTKEIFRHIEIWVIKILLTILYLMSKL